MGRDILVCITTAVFPRNITILIIDHATHPQPDAHPSIALELSLGEYRVRQAVVSSYRFLLRLTVRGPEERGGTAEWTQQCVRYMPAHTNSSCQGKPLPRRAFEGFQEPMEPFFFVVLVLGRPAKRPR